MSGSTKPNTINLPGAQLTVVDNFLSNDEATALYKRLKRLHWQRGEVTVFGRTYEERRKTIFFSDTGIEYVYSGKKNPSRPFPEFLHPLLARLRKHTGIVFNGALANYYEHGEEKLGPHSDDERGVGRTIASISLGATRKFQIRPKSHHKEKGRSLDIDTTNGMLIIMAGDMQKNYVHSIPVQKRVTEGRINLTFREFLT